MSSSAGVWRRAARLETTMLNAGVNPKVVSEMLGHTSVAITLDRYSHVIPTLQEDAVRRLNEVLRVAPR